MDLAPKILNTAKNRGESIPCHPLRFRSHRVYGQLTGGHKMSFSMHVGCFWWQRGIYSYLESSN